MTPHDFEPVPPGELGLHRVYPCRTVAENAAAALDVLRWGYQRSISPAEMRGALWVRYGPHAIFWYTWLDDPSTRELLVHLCVSPDMRGAIYPRKWTTAVGLFAEVMGARRLVFLGGVGDHPVEDYLVRLGWKRRDEGLAYELPSIGVETHGQDQVAEGSAP